MKENDLLCPSASCTAESFLFGILNESGEVNYTQGPIPVDDMMIESLAKISSPEKHFRFTTRCHNNGCGQWSEGKCSIAAEFKQVKEEVSFETPVPCSIKDACRWVHQEGIFSCNICKYIVTDITSE